MNVNINKRRSIAIFLVATLMCCAPFVCLADDAEAAVDFEEKSDFKYSIDKFVEILYIHRVQEYPTAADVVFEGDCEINEFGYDGKTILVKEGANVSTGHVLNLFHNCTLIIEGAFTISPFAFVFSGETKLYFDYITADVSLFGNFGVGCNNGLAVEANSGNNGYTVLSKGVDESEILFFSDYVHIKAKGHGIYDAYYGEFGYTDKTGYVNVPDMTYQRANKTAEELVMKNVTFKGDFEKEHYSIGYQFIDPIDEVVVEEMKKEALEDPAYVETIEIASYDIKLDSKTILALPEGAGLDLSVGPSSNLNEKQIKAAGDRPVYTITMGDVHDLGGGTITVTVPYVLQPGEKYSNIYAVCIDEDGDVEELPTVVDRVNRTVTFTTTHLSDFAIFYDDPSDSEGNSIWFIAAFALATVVMVAAVVFGFVPRKTQ